jgi:hypothetical protein
MDHERTKPLLPTTPHKKFRFTPFILVLVGIALIAIGIIAFLETRQPQATQVPIEVYGAPHLKVDRESVDLGEVKLNQKVTATFELSNAGDRPLEFTEEPYIEVVEGC